MIGKLETTNVGPIPRMDLTFGSRLNLLTGDNGLGKSFLLDLAWWAMTRTWPADLTPALTCGRMALPNNKKQKAEIASVFSGASTDISTTTAFQPQTQSWALTAGRPGIPGFVFYALADGSFAVWDPARNYSIKKAEAGKARPPAYVFSPTQVWDGQLNDKGTWTCNGLIRDWASWQKENGRAFALLSAALKVLSPPEDAPLVPGDLTRIDLDDVRDMPTLRMPYGLDVAVVHASSGMRRIIALAYFLVWCWEEHLKARALQGEAPETRAVFLVDEVEAHLHPKWQRTIIPTLMQVMNHLNPQAEVQLIAATHSPLVMASIEPHFHPDQDAWFDMDLVNQEVVLTKRPFERRGDARNWLTSEAFDLDSTYAVETAEVLEKASVALSDPNFGQQEGQALDIKLRTVLSDTDPFWMRWRYVAEKKGWLS